MEEFFSINIVNFLMLIKIIIIIIILSVFIMSVFVTIVNFFNNKTTQLISLN